MLLATIVAVRTLTLSELNICYDLTSKEKWNLNPLFAPLGVRGPNDCQLANRQPTSVSTYVRIPYVPYQLQL